MVIFYKNLRMLERKIENQEKNTNNSFEDVENFYKNSIQKAISSYKESKSINDITKISGGYTYCCIRYIYEQTILKFKKFVKNYFVIFFITFICFTPYITFIIVSFFYKLIYFAVLRICRLFNYFLGNRVLSIYEFFVVLLIYALSLILMVMYKDYFISVPLSSYIWQIPFTESIFLFSLLSIQLYVCWLLPFCFILLLNEKKIKFNDNSLYVWFVYILIILLTVLSNGLILGLHLKFLLVKIEYPQFLQTFVLNWPIWNQNGYDTIYTPFFDISFGYYSQSLRYTEQIFMPSVCLFYLFSIFLSFIMVSVLLFLFFIRLLFLKPKSSILVIKKQINLKADTSFTNLKEYNILSSIWSLDLIIILIKYFILGIISGLAFYVIFEEIMPGFYIKPTQYYLDYQKYLLFIQKVWDNLYFKYFKWVRKYRINMKPREYQYRQWMKDKRNKIELEKQKKKKGV